MSKITIINVVFGIVMAFLVISFVVRLSAVASVIEHEKQFKAECIESGGTVLMVTSYENGCFVVKNGRIVEYAAPPQE